VTYTVLQDGEIANRTAILSYRAACPSCGHDCHWKSVLLGIVGGRLGGRAAVDVEIECWRCK
jgi:hypothetical protein